MLSFVRLHVTPTNVRGLQNHSLIRDHDSALFFSPSGLPGGRGNNSPEASLAVTVR